MKKYLFILFLTLSTSLVCFSQPGDGDGQGGKLANRMKEYIQRRLSLTRPEAEKFSPVFMRYLLELRQTHRDFQGDGPMQQLKIAELRVRFRDEFRQVLDEQRANKVFECQREFEIKIKEELQNRQMENRRPRIRMMNIPD